LCAGAEYQREELPQIYDKNYDEFVAYLENLGATVNFESEVTVDSLKPVQNEISLERMARIMTRVKEGYYKDLNLLKLPLFVSKDGYILDGHHRWATLFFLSPTNTLDIYRVNLTYKELVDKALNFDDAGTEKFMIGGMVTRQDQLDTAQKITIKKPKVEIFWGFEADFRYIDFVRVEGSSQALLLGSFEKGKGFYSGFSTFSFFIKSVLSDFWSSVIEDNIKVNTKGTDWKAVQTSYIKEEKRSKAYDFFLNRRETSNGILELFDTDLPNYKNGFSKLYTKTVATCIEQLLLLLNSTDWTNRTEQEFYDTVEYKSIQAFFSKNISQIIIALQEVYGTTQSVFDYSDSLRYYSFTSTTTSSTQTSWNWRFKTQEEFENEFGTNWRNESNFVTTNMDYLLGKSIQENDESKKIIQNYFTKKVNVGLQINPYQVFGISRFEGNDKEWVIFGNNITNKPLPTTAKSTATTNSTQIGSPNKKVYFGSSKDLSNQYNMTQTKFKQVRRYSYMSWEDVVSVYKRVAISNNEEEQFVLAVMIVLNNARLTTTKQSDFTESQVREALQNNTPTPTMKALFSKSYYFSPLLYQFYALNFERYLIDWVNVGLSRIQNPFQPEIDNILQIPQISSYINPAIDSYRGLIGLGSYLTSQGAEFCPDIVTNAYSNSIFKAYLDRTNIENLDLITISKNLRWNSNSISYGFFESQTDSGEFVRPEFLLLGSLYSQKVDFYKQIITIPTDFMYAYDDNSKLKDFQYSEKYFTANEYIYTPFAEDLIEPVYVLTDARALLNNFQAENIINTNEYSEMYDVLKKCKLFNGDSNDSFLNFYYEAGASLELDELLVMTVSLTIKEQESFKQFLKIFQTWVINNANGYISQKVDEAITNYYGSVNTLQNKQTIAPAVSTATPTQQMTSFPSTNSITWGGEFNVGDNVKIRFDYSTDFGNGASSVPYDSPQNVFKITSKKILAGLIKPENPTGVLYNLSNGTKWEGKDLESIGVMTTSTAPAWNWRFKTKQEFEKEYGNNWKQLLNWDLKGKMDYLFGQPLQEKPHGKIVINNFVNNINTAYTVNTEDAFGLVSPTNDNMWELKLQMFTQEPLPVTATPTTQTQQGQTRTREVYYNELLYNGVLKKNEKIVGARFLTAKEIRTLNKENYGIDELSFAIILLAQDYPSATKKDAIEYIERNNIWFLDLYGKKLDNNLLPMVVELFKFQKSLDPATSKELFRTSYQQDKDPIRNTRLRLGTSNIDSSEFALFKNLFPKITMQQYGDLAYFRDIKTSQFPDWYKLLLEQLYKSRKDTFMQEDFEDMNIGQDIYDPVFFYTGERLDKYAKTNSSYLEIPTSYLMLEIEDISAPVKSQVTATSNPENIKKLKEEYSALQYYLNVEVPIDAFAQRKMISSVMSDVSNKLEQQIEALYYAPSFEPLFELWADKQTQGQRTINLQSCMLPTPNGEKSELDLVQYEIVRTEEFKKWFGDWEEAAITGNYNGVSKAINPLTKEPQVVFHGKANMALEFTKMAFATFPIKYFGTNLSYAEWFADNQSKSDALKKLVYEFFLDIKNPIDLSPIGLTELTAEDLKEVIKAQYNYQIQTPIVSEGTGVKLKLWSLIRGSAGMLQELKSNTYFDGIIMYEDNPSDSTASGYDSKLLGFSPNSYDVVQKVAGSAQGNFTLDYVTFTNFQIKAADGRNKTFFNKVEDFRFAKGGITKKRKK
jgi:hypothetical protein